MAHADRGVWGGTMSRQERPQAANQPIAEALPYASAGPGEQHFRLVIEAAPNAMIMVNGDGLIVLINSQTEKLFGYNRMELLGRSVETLVPVRFRGHHGHSREGFFARPDTRAMGAGRDLYGLKKDGSEVPIEIGLNPLHLPEGVFVLASIIDITERKRAEERLRLVVEAAPNAMLMVNRHGCMVLVNSEAEKLFGYSRQELLGRPVETLIPARFRAHHAQHRGAFFSRPDTRAMGAGRDLYGLRKDGIEVPIEIGLNPLHTAEGDFVLASVIDITERLAAEKLLRITQADSLRQSILDSLPFSIIATSTDGTILAANPAAERLLGYPRQELVGQPAMVMHDQAELEQRATELSQQVGTDIPPNFQVIVASGSRDSADEREWTYLRKDGVRLPVNVAITAMRDDNGRVNGFLKVAYDITQRKHAEAYIRHMAHHDALTALPNRALLLDRLGMAIRHAQRHELQVAVLMMDLDHFKRVNDLLGHPIGDQLLLTISQRLRRCVREVDTVARLGGDEFVLLLTEVRRREDLLPVIDQVMQSVSAPMLIEGHELLVTPSIGGCLYPADGTDATSLLKYADTAMYQAKAAGRSNFQWFSQAMLQQTKDKLALGSALRRAIESRELSIHYQPEVSLRDGRVTGMEALVRWQCLQQGSVSPDRFIPVAEESGLILQLGEWVLRTACEEGVAIQRRLGRRIMLAVNVSPRQFQQKEWPNIVRQALEESGLEPRCLEIEITESTLMHNPEESAEILRGLRRLGVTVVVDDFGTGYSSLSYLTRFPIDKIKIDRSFVRDLTTDAADAAIINAIISMAHSLDIRVVAEGVETDEQLRYLQERGCDQVQGFRYSSAVPAGDFPGLLAGIESRLPC
jgi:diguanylate cyclase (GGDEF)-like protein/PAS domain S-box-containing protein